MPHDVIPSVPADRAQTLAAELDGLQGTELLGAALSNEVIGQTAMVSSFGADSIVLLHQLAQVAPATPVLFIDTQMLFPETLDYQREVAETLGLTGIRVIRARAMHLAVEDPANALHLRDIDACCDLRKTRPLAEALKPFDSWITGRKRFQNGARAGLPLVEERDGKLKLNPLAGWSSGQIADYIRAHKLPRHPLVAKGYPSIGCAPCTSPVAEGEDPRSGRWRGQDKEECGIHFVDGKMVRTGPGATSDAA
ncbi:phosphoadenylylsulfate reductase (thioredoxin) [Aliiruegeria haliotis]|uniref:Adenosine 5'-phosphosulfate reductase n=1 Tax=Aliiruegeria haliotis TaxID=1280846 RepID=A0A2T0RZ45_9RHOB|nr:phosphoadenylyl-sulfate reductase [Aliiruegeria haliotis]PRY26459.1 phosphoadenylylsulfate reductase (thioredoxin) [Aliiruegeria haliotis]